MKLIHIFKEANNIFKINSGQIKFRMTCRPLIGCDEYQFEDIFTSDEAKEILRNKYVLFIGDSG
jgi:hypothetical protein